MASLFTRAEATAAGLTYATIRWRVRQGTYVRLAPGVYFKGDRPPLPFERKVAEQMRLIVRGELAAALHGFDGFDAPRDGRYSNVPKESAFHALLAIAATTTDVKWEQALEWCLRKKYVTISEIEKALTLRRVGNNRIRRVLNLRPVGAPPTESMLETLAVQLLRTDPQLPTPTRQVWATDKIRVDLAWPELGVFLELDGEQHIGQPQYDATRQTAVVAATGWLVGRFTWTDITRQPKSTLRQISTLVGL